MPFCADLAFEPGNDNHTFSVNLPISVVVVKAWVAAANETLLPSNMRMSRRVMAGCASEINRAASGSFQGVVG
jgi:hypothetical protein